MTTTITILGCGSSGGVPRVGSGWGACDPSEPRNRRRRCSILVEREGPGGTTAVLVDTSPDLRDQLLEARVSRLDGVLYTHDHADHTHGIDDLRPLVIHMRRVLPVWIEPSTAPTVTSRFAYCFHTPEGSDYSPIVREMPMRAGVDVHVDGPGGPIVALPFIVHHGQATDALGFRFGKTAYTPDVNAIPDESLAALEDLDLWIIDALRPSRHPTHFSLAEALAWIQRMKPRRAVLTNLHIDLDYATLSAELPAGVTVGYDGLRLSA